MPARDAVRYVVAALVGLAMYASNDAPWTTVGIVVLAATVVAFAWHRQLASRRKTGAPADRE